MEVVLSENIKGVGERGERKSVKPGYARNYLLPKGLAYLLSDPLSQELESEFERRGEQERGAKVSEGIAQSIQNLNLEFVLSAEKGKKTYTGITAKKISNELNKKYQIQAEKVGLKGSLKEAGDHPVKITVGAKEFEVLVKITSK